MATEPKIKKPSEIAWDLTVVKRDSARADYQQEVANQISFYTEYQGAIALLNTAHVLSCAGGPSGNQYTVLSSSNLTCANSPQNLQIGQLEWQSARDNAVRLQNIVQQYEVSVPAKKEVFHQAEIDEAFAYKVMIADKMQGMTPSELNDYANVGVSAEADIQKAKNRTYIYISITVILLGIAGFFIWKKFSK